MKSLVFFNNKGGVGKTTLAANVAAYLNMHLQRRVLLIDADPQCNATQSILSDELCEKIYLSDRPRHQTLHSYLKPLDQGEPSINSSISPILASTNRFNTDIIPGHPNMSVVEDRLSAAWTGLQGADTAGYRITNWCTQLLQPLQDRYDLIIFDVGPSLGALNRSIILASDYIVTPFGCDIFSLLGINNISRWIKYWDRQYCRAIESFQEDKPDELDRYPGVKDTAQHFRFAGYSVQQYIVRKFKTGTRAVAAYDRIMKKIPDTVEETLAFLTPPGTETEQLKLGDIPFVYSLAPLAQTAKAPIHALGKGDRLVGSQYQQVSSYGDLMQDLCDRLVRNVGLA
jgi:cellulose biosynthesis protein BcsQ